MRFTMKSAPGQREVERRLRARHDGPWAMAQSSNYPVFELPTWYGNAFTPVHLECSEAYLDAFCVTDGARRQKPISVVEPLFEAGEVVRGEEQLAGVWSRFSACFDTLAWWEWRSPGATVPVRAFGLPHASEHSFTLAAGEAAARSVLAARMVEIANGWDITRHPLNGPALHVLSRTPILTRMFPEMAASAGAGSFVHA